MAGTPKYLGPTEQVRDAMDQAPVRCLSGALRTKLSPVCEGCSEDAQ